MFCLLGNQRDDLVGRETQMNGLRQKAIEGLAEPLLADFPRQFAAGLGHEHAQPGPRVQNPLPFQLGVYPGDGVRIDDQGPRKLADRGEPLLGLEFPRATASRI